MSEQTPKNLLWLWVGQFISLTGDFLFFSVILFLVLTVEQEYESVKAGVVSFLNTLPFLLFGLFAGSIVDRYSRRRVMLISDFVRGFVLILTPLFFALGWIHWVTLGILAFTISSFATLFNPARDALIPLLVPQERLISANAWIQSSFQLAMVTGTFLAGILLGFQEIVIPRTSSALQLIHLLFLDGLTFFLSFFTVLQIRVQESPSSAGTRSISQDIREGVWYIVRTPWLVGLLLLTAVDNLFIMGPAFVASNLLIKNTLGLSAKYLAFFTCALAVGWLLGGFFLLKWGKYLPKGYTLFFGIFMDGVTYLPFLFIRSYPSALIFIGIHGFFIPFITVVRTSILQAQVPAQNLGKIFAMVNLTVMGITALSAFLTGILGEILSPPTLFFIGGAGGALSAILGFLLLPSLRVQP